MAENIEILELDQKIVNTIVQNTTKQNEEWLGVLRQQKATATKSRNTFLLSVGFDLPEGALRALGYSDMDFMESAATFDRVPHPYKRLKPSGDVEEGVKYTYKIAGMRNPYEQVFISTEQYIMTELKVSPEDRTALRVYEDKVAALSDELEQLGAGLESKTKKEILDAHTRTGVLREEIRKNSAAWKEALLIVGAKYNAHKGIQDYLKEEKMGAAAKIEKSIRKENFTIMLINLKIAAIRAELNDRLLKSESRAIKRGAEIVELSKRILPTPAAQLAEQKTEQEPEAPAEEQVAA
jgi:hypothetical protein